MDALFGGCSIAGALIASGGYKFAPIPIDAVCETTEMEGSLMTGFYYHDFIMPHEIFIVVSISSAGANQSYAHDAVWIQRGALLSFTSPYKDSAGNTIHGNQVSIYVPNSTTVRVIIPAQNGIPCIPLGYIYQL